MDSESDWDSVTNDKSDSEAVTAQVQRKPPRVDLHKSNLKSTPLSKNLNVPVLQRPPRTFSNISRESPPDNDEDEPGHDLSVSTDQEHNDMYDIPSEIQINKSKELKKNEGGQTGGHHSALKKKQSHPVNENLESPPALESQSPGAPPGVHLDGASVEHGVMLDRDEPYDNPFEKKVARPRWGEQGDIIEAHRMHRIQQYRVERGQKDLGPGPIVRGVGMRSDKVKQKKALGVTNLAFDPLPQSSDVIRGEESNEKEAPNHLSKPNTMVRRPASESGPDIIVDSDSNTQFECMDNLPPTGHELLSFPHNNTKTPTSRYCYINIGTIQENIISHPSPAFMQQYAKRAELYGTKVGAEIANTMRIVTNFMLAALLELLAFVVLDCLQKPLVGVMLIISDGLVKPTLMAIFNLFLHPFVCLTYNILLAGRVILHPVMESLGDLLLGPTRLLRSFRLVESHSSPVPLRVSV